LSGRPPPHLTRWQMDQYYALIALRLPWLRPRAGCHVADWRQSPPEHAKYRPPIQHNSAVFVHIYETFIVRRNTWRARRRAQLLPSSTTRLSRRQNAVHLLVLRPLWSLRFRVLLHEGKAVDDGRSAVSQFPEKLPRRLFNGRR